MGCGYLILLLCWRWTTKSEIVCAGYVMDDTKERIDEWDIAIDPGCMIIRYLPGTSITG